MSLYAKRHHECPTCRCTDPAPRTPDPAQIRADALRDAAQAAHDATTHPSAYACKAAILALLATPLSPTAVDGSPAPDAGGKEGV